MIVEIIKWFKNFCFHDWEYYPTTFKIKGRNITFPTRLRICKKCKLKQRRGYLPKSPNKFKNIGYKK